MFMRGTAALEFIRGGLDFVAELSRVMLLISLDGRYRTIMPSLISTLFVPTTVVVSGVIILVASRPLARFAANFAEASDAAAHF